MELAHSIDQIDDQVTVHLAGDLDPGIADELYRLLLTVIATPEAAIVEVDLQDVTLISLTAVGVLIAGRRAAAAAKRRFLVSRARGLVRQILELTGVVRASWFF